MKRLTILFMLFLTSCILYAKDRKGNDLSGPIALKGELTEKYQNYTKGTPVVIRGVRKMRISPDETAGITYAVEIDGLQYPVGAEEAGKIIRLKPATVLEYWQGVYLSQGMYDYYNRKGYRYKMRQELDEECLDYLDKLNETVQPCRCAQTARVGGEHHSGQGHRLAAHNGQHRQDDRQAAPAHAGEVVNAENFFRFSRFQ